MLFANGYFYYQDGNPPGTKIFRLPYKTGDLQATGSGDQVADITVYVSSTDHWPKALDIADDGTIYVGNGGDQGEPCDPSHPFHGGILSIDPAPGGANPGGVRVTRGLRNPISIRCPKGHDLCFALELSTDYTATTGGREKLIPIRKGDDWGFPCCATMGLPYVGSPPGTDCSMVAAETNSFLVGDTPFSLDFEPGSWNATWGNQAYVALHGELGRWTGTRLVAIPMNTTTGMPQPSTDTNMGMEMGMVDFATGWDDQTQTHGRPAALAFSGDGRLFVANDTNGVIFWIAPLDL
jgi:glucose/arabinose dehydrogenase